MYMERVCSRFVKRSCGFLQSSGPRHHCLIFCKRWDWTWILHQWPLSMLPTLCLKIPLTIALFSFFDIADIFLRVSHILGPLALQQLQQTILAGMKGTVNKAQLNWLRWGSHFHYHLPPAHHRPPLCASKVSGIVGFAHLPWLAPDVIKTEVSTFHVHFIWLVLIFPLCPS
jgi:hypothetical protein